MTDMSAELQGAHLCQHVSCKCSAPSEDEYCNAFCEAGGSASDEDHKCGCGHMACDYTKQMGNESTFDMTGS